MRQENERMRSFLASNGIICTPKYIETGSMKRTWRLYNRNAKWTPGLAEKLNMLGFTDYNHKPLGEFSGNGGMFSVFVRGHYELLDEV